MEKKISQLQIEILTPYFQKQDCPCEIQSFIISEEKKIAADFSTDEYCAFNSLLIGICLQGKKDVQINFKDYTIEKQTLFAILPNYVFRTKYRSEDFDGHIMFLTLNCITEMTDLKELDLLMKIQAYPCIKITEENTQNLLEIHSLFLKHYKNKNSPYYKPLLKSILNSFIFEIANLYSVYYIDGLERLKTRQIEITERFFILLQESFPKERSISYYAEKLCITPKHLSTVVKKTTNHPALKWINSYIILDAKRLLKTTHSTIIEISEMLKFQSPSFFIQFFKQHTGETPLRYRKE
ncbi:MAG: helix-turn-helix domain-containing protein [Bacteroidales bacterium]|nr:helix-turn-helix domain-containing protein [Bacteroidales bacterium]